MKNILSVLLIGIICISCSHEDTKNQDQNKTDIITLNMGEVTLQVPVKIKKKHIIINNAEEQIVLDYNKNKKQAKFPVFDTGLDFETDSSGFWNKYYIEDYQLPFKLSKTDHKYNFTEEPETKRYQITFSPNTPENYPAIGIFQVDADKNIIKGSFATETGDYRYLIGEIENNKFQLNTFDGSHAFVFTGEFKRDSIVNGMFYSGKHWKEAFIGVKNTEYTLQNPDSISKAISEVKFSFHNTDSTVFKFDQNTYKDTAVIIQILGTWCPNCLDETKFLSTVEKKYADKPIKIIGIAFESRTNLSYYRNQISRLRESTGIQYPILLGGKASKSVASDTLVFIDQIKSFPTTIVLDRDHKIKKVHTGFYGPGTGSYYQKFTEEFYMLLDKITE